MFQTILEWVDWTTITIIIIIVITIVAMFQIILEWVDNRATFHNLKLDTSLNALTDQDIQQLWLPLVIISFNDNINIINNNYIIIISSSSSISSSIIIIIISITRNMKVIYDNTDQKDTTRLGEVWEWSTKVTVTRSYQDSDDDAHNDHHNDHEND